MRSRIITGMLKLSKPMGSVRMAALLETMPWPARVLHGQQAPSQPRFAVGGTRSMEPALAKRNLCSHRAEPACTERVFGRTLHFSGCLSAVSEQLSQIQPGVTPGAAWHSAQGLFYFTMCHRN